MGTFSPYYFTTMSFFCCEAKVVFFVFTRNTGGLCCEAQTAIFLTELERMSSSRISAKRFNKKSGYMKKTNEVLSVAKTSRVIYKNMFSGHQ